MKTFCACLALLAGLTLGACDSGARQAISDPTPTSLPEGVDELLSPSTSGGVELGRSGLSTVREEGTRTEVPFGTPVTQVAAMLEPILGAPDSATVVPDCGSGAATTQTVWPGLLLLSADGKFTGWEASDRKFAVIGKQTELTIGSSLSQVQAVLGPLGLTRSPRGYEFVLTRNGAEFAGAFPTNEPTAPLIAFSSGANCYVR